MRRDKWGMLVYIWLVFACVGVCQCMCVPSVGQPCWSTLSPQLTSEPLKRTPAGMRLAAQAEVVAQMTVRQALEQLGAGTMVHKAWVRDGRPKGSTRQVKAHVHNDLVLLNYQSGVVKRSTSVVVVRCCLTVEQNKSILQLETDQGTLTLQPLTPQHETLWALGLNGMLHLAEKQGELNQTTVLEELPWHGIVQGEHA